MATSIFAGTSGNDVIKGTIGDDWVDAGAGVDRISLLDGNDTVKFTADVTDTIYKGAGSLTLDFSEISTGVNLSLSRGVWRNGTVDFLTETKPTLVDLSVTGTALNDTISAIGHVRGVVIDGGEGNDTLLGGLGNDVLKGGEGDDTISLGLGNDVIELGGGTNVLMVNAGLGSQKIKIDLETGTSKIWNTVSDFTKGLDAKYTTTFSGDLDSVTLYRAAEVTGSSSSDNVRILGGTGQVLNLGAGYDYVATKLAGVIANGGDDADYFDGSYGDAVGAVGLTSTFNGGAGDDMFVLRNDKASGGDGDDSFDGTGTIEGGKGNDVITGGAVTLTYGDSQGIVFNGTDTEQKFAVIEIAEGVEVVVHKYEYLNDYYGVTNADGTVSKVAYDKSVSASSVNQVVDAESYTDTFGLAFSKLYGTESNDIFFGGKVATIYGMGGDDYFHLFGKESGFGTTNRLAYGGAGDDHFEVEDGFKGSIYGEAGDDLLLANAGSSVSAWGGAGYDEFGFKSDAGEGAATNFVIRDFVTNVDALWIDLSFADNYADLMKMRVGGNSTYTIFEDSDGDRLTVYGKFDADDCHFSY